MNVKTGEHTGVTQTTEKKSELSPIYAAPLMGGIQIGAGISDVVANQLFPG